MDDTQQAGRSSVKLRTEIFDVLCAQRGLHTNQDKAERFGVSTRTIIRLRQRKSGPSYTLAKLIAEELGTDPEALFGPDKAPVAVPAGAVKCA